MKLVKGCNTEVFPDAYYSVGVLRPVVGGVRLVIADLASELASNIFFDMDERQARKLSEDLSKAIDYLGEESE